MTVPILKKGQKIPATAFNQIARRDRSSRTISKTRGLKITESPGGTVVQFKDPNRTRWVFVIETYEDGALVKEAKRTTGGQWLISNANTVFAVPYAPNYYEVHFEFFVLGARSDEPPNPIQPRPIDAVCKVEGGFLVPDYRMRLVEPVAVDDLCEPCSEGAPGVPSDPGQPGGCVGCEDDAELNVPVVSRRQLGEVSG